MITHVCLDFSPTQHHTILSCKKIIWILKPGSFYFIPPTFTYFTIKIFRGKYLHCLIHSLQVNVPYLIFPTSMLFQYKQRASFWKYTFYIFPRVHPLLLYRRSLSVFHLPWIFMSSYWLFFFFFFFITIRIFQMSPNLKNIQKNKQYIFLSPSYPLMGQTSWKNYYYCHSLDFLFSHLFLPSLHQTSYHAIDTIFIKVTIDSFVINPMTRCGAFGTINIFETTSPWLLGLLALDLPPTS